jgi:hypothetical protein
MSMLGYSPAAILSILRYANPELLLVQRDVYKWLLKVYLPFVSFLFFANNLYRNLRRWTLVFLFARPFC